MDDRRMQILRRLEGGEIGAEEAARLLASLAPLEGRGMAPQAAAGPGAEQGETISVAPQAGGRDGQKWRRFWIYPVVASTAMLALGALLLGLVYADGAAGGWLICGWPLAVVGFLAFLVAVWSRFAKWLHVRIREEGGRRIAFSFPLPLTLTAWVLRIAQRFVPQLKETGADDIIIALRDSKREEPLHVQIDDDEKGEHVEVYVG